MPETVIKQVKLLDNSVYDIGVDTSNVDYDGSTTKFSNKNLTEIISILDTQSSSGGEVNILEQVKRNGITLPITNKSVDVEVPTSTSELVNDGEDGSSPFATEYYVDSNSGDENVIEVVKVNGTALTPDSSKAVNVVVPTKTSDLTNDSNFVSDANYVHTDNNYTTTEKTKLAGIQEGAEVNVQSDWNQTDNSADDFIKNKPSIPTKVSDLTNDSNFQTASQVSTTVSSAIDALPASTITNTDISNWNAAEENVQSDWNQTTTTADDYIKNKPPLVYNTTTTTSQITGKLNITTQATADNDVPTFKQVKDLIGQHVGVRFEIYPTFEDLPAEGEEGVFYLIPKSLGPEFDVYDEYIWIADSAGYEHIGNTSVYIERETDTFIKSYPGVTTSITPVNGTTTVVSSVSSSSTANVRGTSVTVLTGLGTASKATVVTGISTTPSTVYGAGTTSVLSSATVTDGVLSFGSSVVANSTTISVLTGVSASGTEQVVTSYAGATTSIYPAADVEAITGITAPTTSVAKAGTSTTVLTGLGVPQTGVAVTDIWTT